MAVWNEKVVPFVDRKIGEEFEVHLGGNSWVGGRKVAEDRFEKVDGYVIGVSCWTKTRVAKEAKRITRA